MYWQFRVEQEDSHHKWLNVAKNTSTQIPCENGDISNFHEG